MVTEECLGMSNSRSGMELFDSQGVLFVDIKGCYKKCSDEWPVDESEKAKNLYSTQYAHENQQLWHLCVPFTH